MSLSTTGLCRASGNSAGKRSGEARDRGSLFGDDGGFGVKRDWPVLRLRRQRCGKSKTIPNAPRNRNCAELRGGAGRTQTDHQPIMGLKVIGSTAARLTIARTIGWQECVPSIWHDLRKRRHSGIVPIRAVDDRGQYTRRRDRLLVPYPAGTWRGLRWSGCAW
jgi:hypothetical protein